MFVCIYTYYNITNNTIAASHLLFFLHRTHKIQQCSVFIFLGISASHYTYMFYSENVLIHELIHLVAIPWNWTTEWKEKKTTKTVYQIIRNFPNGWNKADVLKFTYLLIYFFKLFFDVLVTNFDFSEANCSNINNSGDMQLLEKLLYRIRYELMSTTVRTSLCRMQIIWRKPIRCFSLSTFYARSLSLTLFLYLLTFPHFVTIKLNKNQTAMHQRKKDLFYACF